MPVLKGTRDFLPSQVRIRKFLIEKLTNIFETYGFEPIETPSFEKNETFINKYGKEGDKLIFRILNSGDFLKNIENIKEHDYKSLRNYISEKSLRYDLTVPFSRFVSDNYNNLYFPFRRYQIQNVWRADRPQKSRYREFLQCDIDVIGSDSTYIDAEIVKIAYLAYKSILDNNFIIEINNRKILQGLANKIGADNMFASIANILDKKHKVSKEKYITLLSNIGLKNKQIDIIIEFNEIEGSIESKLKKLKNFYSNSDIGLEGIEEVYELIEYIELFEIDKKNYDFQHNLARGLDYYTSTIYEVKQKNSNLSIGGGGRYNELTKISKNTSLPGIGFSFGLDRIIDILDSKNHHFEKHNSTTEFMLINNDNIELKTLVSFLEKIRSLNISSELYPKKETLKKQLKYSNKKGIKHVIFLDKYKEGKIEVKDMKTGKQTELLESTFINSLNKENKNS